jgi:hypothetical protein
MKPDKDIEDFWLTLKCCIINFFKAFNINSTDFNIDEVSYLLNKLQRDKEYEKIEYTINNYMFFLIQKLLEKITYLENKNSFYLYYGKIILTNIKRWGKIRERKIFFKDHVKNEGLFYILADCLKSCIRAIEKNRNKKLIIKGFYEISKLLIFANDEKSIIKIYQKIINLSIDINNGAMIDIIKSKYNVIDYINLKYGLKLPKTISGKKINNFMQKSLVC